MSVGQNVGRVAHGTLPQAMMLSCGGSGSSCSRVVSTLRISTLWVETAGDMPVVVGGATRAEGLTKEEVVAAFVGGLGGLTGCCRRWLGTTSLGEGGEC